MQQWEHDLHVACWEESMGPGLFPSLLPFLFSHYTCGKKLHWHILVVVIFFLLPFSLLPKGEWSQNCSCFPTVIQYIWKQLQFPEDNKNKIVEWKLEKKNQNAPMRIDHVHCRRKGMNAKIKVRMEGLLLAMEEGGGEGGGIIPRPPLHLMSHMTLKGKQIF